MKYLRIITSRSKGSKFMDQLEKHGAKSISCLLAEGSANDHILEVLGINKEKKEIVSALVNDELVKDLLDKLKEKFDKKNTSIMFTTPLDLKGEVNMEYEALYVIVNKENADKVIEISQKEGARGATVVHGRGSGIQKKSVFLNMTIEPEKDIVIMLIKKEIAEKVKSSIYEAMNLEENSQGILFSLPVSDVRGLVEQN
ncbi:P-II family nitrogen regulator [Anaerococcus hydrogenalis]|uniref:P-II family nitrogen regulator n=1 Tax=Anaerococcus hydrogenalis TaxID=33029 RepID=UPI001D239D97|nr:P-II family nitrogen regulator [Anaerococcus hydrogenalis]MBS5989308.1 transcriptional regulator [Anaerococcus hydrogenalis]